MHINLKKLCFASSEKAQKSEFDNSKNSIDDLKKNIIFYVMIEMNKLNDYQVESNSENSLQFYLKRDNQLKFKSIFLLLDFYIKERFKITDELKPTFLQEKSLCEASNLKKKLKNQESQEKEITFNQNKNDRQQVFEISLTKQKTKKTFSLSSKSLEFANWFSNRQNVNAGSYSCTSLPQELNEPIASLTKQKQVKLKKKNSLHSKEYSLINSCIGHRLSIETQVEEEDDSVKNRFINNPDPINRRNSRSLDELVDLNTPTSRNLLRKKNLKFISNGSSELESKKLKKKEKKLNCLHDPRFSHSVSFLNTLKKLPCESSFSEINSRKNNIFLKLKRHRYIEKNIHLNKFEEEKGLKTKKNHSIGGFLVNFFTGSSIKTKNQIENFDLDFDSIKSSNSSCSCSKSDKPTSIIMKKDHSVLTESYLLKPPQLPATPPPSKYFSSEPNDSIKKEYSTILTASVVSSSSSSSSTSSTKENQNQFTLKKLKTSNSTLKKFYSPSVYPRSYQTSSSVNNDDDDDYSEPFDILSNNLESQKEKSLKKLTKAETKIICVPPSVACVPSTAIPVDQHNYHHDELNTPTSSLLFENTNSCVLQKSKLQILDLKSKHPNESNKKEDDTDSAYSSCLFSQSTLSTPKTIAKKHKITHNNNSSNVFEIEEDIICNTMESSMILSSSSTSSASPFEIPDSHRTVFKSDTQPIKIENSKQNELKILSNYESVSDCIEKIENIKISKKEKSIEKKQFENSDSFKSTITAFDILNERCSELISLFDEDDDKIFRLKKKKNSDTDDMLKEAINRVSEPRKYNYDTLKFLERTLTFNNFMSSSVLITSIAEPLFENKYELKFEEGKEVENPKKFNSIRNFIFKLSQNNKCMLGKNISEFLSCTNKSKVKNPYAVMSNIRQFMNGISNYLTKNEVNNFELRRLIETERADLKLTQILNVDLILEDCFQAILLRELKAKVYYLLVDWLVNDGSLLNMSKNIKFLSKLSDSVCIDYLAFAKPEHKPNLNTLNKIRDFYNRMQCEYAPFIKLKFVLFMINELLLVNRDFKEALNDLSNLNVVEFMPILIFSLSKCNMTAIQIEIDYIWSLVNKQLLSNECTFYLHLLSSACFVLKQIDYTKIKETRTAKEELIYSSIKELDCSTEQLKSKSVSLASNSYMESFLLDVYLPDKNYQTIKLKKIPVKPFSKCKEVCNLITSKFKVYNHEDYALYYLENGVEIKLKDEDEPLELKMEKLRTSGVFLKFIFRQKSANFVLSKYC